MPLLQKFSGEGHLDPHFVCPPDSPPPTKLDPESATVRTEEMMYFLNFLRISSFLLNINPFPLSKMSKSFNFNEKGCR